MHKSKHRNNTIFKRKATKIEIVISILCVVFLFGIIGYLSILKFLSDTVEAEVYCSDKGKEIFSKGQPWTPSETQKCIDTYVRNR